MNAIAPIDLRDVSTFPTRRDEAWRYSDFRRAAPEAVAVAPQIVVAPYDGAFGSIAGEGLVFGNGRTSSGQPTAQLVSGGGVQRLAFVTDADQSGWQASVDIVVQAGAQLTLLESYEGRGAYVASAALTFTLEAGARLERIVLLDEPAEAVSVSRATVRLSPGASFSQSVLATGARLQRHETHLRHPGGGAHVRMDGVYLLDEARHFDLTTVVVHEGEDGEAAQLVKGVAADRSRGVFQGKIIVSPGADKTDARMRHDALLLSDRAEIDAKPELEIYADDVACAHGNTIGALDEDALFYVRSRGVPEAEAKALLTRAHVGEVVARIEHEPAREIVAEWVERRLERLV